MLVVGLRPKVAKFVFQAVLVGRTSDNGVAKQSGEVYLMDEEIEKARKKVDEKYKAEKEWLARFEQLKEVSSLVSRAFKITEWQ